MSGYPNTLKYFMWPYQVYFNTALQTTADSIFKKIGSDLEPTVFMTALRRKKLTGAIVTFEPEKFEQYGEDIFDNFDELSNDHFVKSEQSKMLYSGDGQQEMMTTRHLANHRRLFLTKVLNERSTSNIHYVGTGQLLHGYEIFIVIRFDRIIHDKYIFLNRRQLEDDLLEVTRSIVEVAIDVFLKDAQNLIHIPEAGRSLRDGLRTGSEVLRLATQQFVLSLAFRGNNGNGFHSFYDCCENLSLSTYENETIIGGLIISPKNHSAVEMTTTLSEPFKFSDIRKTAKLLRLTENDIVVVTDSELVFGLGKVNAGKYNADSESIIAVNFTGFHQWEALHNGSRLLRMAHGNFEPVPSGLSVEKIYSDAKRLFTTITKEECQSILELIEAALEVKRGTQIIISENAQSESERLKARCFKTLPRRITTYDLSRLMRIDGGIMIDQHLNLHAYGVLLDGTAARKGDSSRGSRYNSAITYYETQLTTNPTMIVVISDDGIYTLIPDLKPQIDHFQVSKNLGTLIEMETPEKYVHKIFIEIQDWLNQHRFYLTAAECQKVNDSIKKISEHRIKSGNISVTYGEYIANEEMNASYYLPGTA